MHQNVNKSHITSIGLTVMVRAELFQSTSGSLTSSSSSRDPSWCVAWILYTPITTITTRAAIQTTITTVAAGGAAPGGREEKIFFFYLDMTRPPVARWTDLTYVNNVFKLCLCLTWHVRVDTVYHERVMDRSHVLRLSCHVIDMFHVHRVMENTDLQRRTTSHYTYRKEGRWQRVWAQRQTSKNKKREVWKMEKEK